MRRSKSWRNCLCYQMKGHSFGQVNQGSKVPRVHTLRNGELRFILPFERWLGGNMFLLSLSSKQSLRSLRLWNLITTDQAEPSYAASPADALLSYDGSEVECLIDSPLATNLTSQVILILWFAGNCLLHFLQKTESFFFFFTRCRYCRQCNCLVSIWVVFE